MATTIVPHDGRHPEVHVWPGSGHPVVGLSIFCADGATIGVSFTRHQVALLVAALQKADGELEARDLAHAAMNGGLVR